jgi:hypothetical protein
MPLAKKLKARSDHAFSKKAKGTIQVVPLAKKLKARFYKNFIQIIIFIVNLRKNFCFYEKNYCLFP